MKIKDGFMKRKIGDKYLVVTTGARSRQSSMFIELNETSSDIWDWLEAGYDETAITDKLCEKYPVSREKAAEDVSKLLSAMKEAGVLED